MTLARREALAGPKRPARGFTLLELLVGLTVFGLLAATAYAGLRTSAGSWERTEERIARLETRRAIRSFIARQFGQATPLARVAQGRWAVWFQGESDRVVFLSDLPPYLGDGGIHEVAFEIKRLERTEGLVFTRQKLIADAKPGAFNGEDKLERDLGGAIKSLKIEYFGSPDGRRDPEWLDRWREERRMPSLVRLHLTPEDGEAWLPIVARVRSNAIRFLRTQRTSEDSEDDADTGDDAPSPDADDLPPARLTDPPSDAGTGIAPQRSSNQGRSRLATDG